MLAEAITRPPAERDAFLQARCTDPALRRQVEALLKQYDPNFLETVLTVAGAFDRAGSRADEADYLAPGSRVGRYVVIDRLGAGGMGQVFLGNDTQLHRKVALKCLLTSLSGGDLRSKILHEARAAARISHPNIATVHDVIEHEGRAFLVMEYVEGESLANRLRRDRMPLDRVLAFGRQLASALAAAHAKGIVHRDLKPANIQVTPDGSVKVLDFGVAQAISTVTIESTIGTTKLPSAVEMRQPGTPAYMSPEQMLGRAVDHRSDIYSLGVVLYEIATGHRPYSGTDPFDLVVALSKRLLRADAADPNVPREVSDVIAKALEIDPDARFQTATELEAELAALERVYGPMPTQAVRVPMPVSRTRAVLRAIAAVLLIPLVVGFLGFLNTAAFNITLGRTAPFDEEPPAAWFEFGLRSLVTPAMYIVAMLIAIWAIKFGMRVLSLSSRIDHLLTTSRTQTRRLTSRLGLDDPSILAQAVATLGAAALAVVAWRFSDVILACASMISESPPERLLPLRRGNTADAELYRFALDALILVFSAAAWRVVQLRARQPVRRGAGALALIVGMLTTTVVLSELPYRVIWQNQSERIDFGGERCYVIGEHADESLIYCPDKNPPRNRVIKRNDPAVRRVGIVENIFTPPESSR